MSDLRGSDLGGSDLRGADLRGADLRGANLSGANLSGAKEDLFKILDSAPNEVKGLLDYLNAGKVDGSTYTGECCCLVGTIANVRGCNYEMLEGITPDSNRPAERWFLAIRKGHTPENNPIAKITAEWVEEWIEKNKEGESA
ncbi:pentapeptide repeat-containing protein [Paenibacillus rigui]|uniref:pentapeptide repeat-containing protein n=1 Tax=Paenibacillus rigui TaxID=554312 RepID=UPI002481E029|nr:pentapeptide repeat-containing protein [Paenibacillus rigui]